MTLNEFLLLQDNEQTDLLYRQGVYIGKRKEAEKIIVLYQLYSFYIEIIYSKYRHTIIRLNWFTSTDVLNPYLKYIDVEELIRCAG